MIYLLLFYVHIQVVRLQVRSLVTCLLIRLHVLLKINGVVYTLGEIF